MFYVPKRNQHLIRTSLPTSHGFEPLPREGAQAINNPMPPGKGTPFTNLFGLGATIDNSPYLCFDAALRFRNEICGGEEEIATYCTNLAIDAGRKLADVLGTEGMEEGAALKRCCFANVRLPLALGNGDREVKDKDAVKVAQWIAEKLVTEYDTFLGIYIHGGKLWLRFSAQIYIDLDDVMEGAVALKELCERVALGEYLET